MLNLIITILMDHFIMTILSPRTLPGIKKPVKQIDNFKPKIFHIIAVRLALVCLHNIRRKIKNLGKSVK